MHIGDIFLIEITHRFATGPLKIYYTSELLYEQNRVFRRFLNRVHGTCNI